MTRTEKDILLTRIISGVFIYRDNTRKLFIYPPDRLTKQLAYEHYADMLDSILFEDWLSHEDIQSFLLKSQVIPPDVDELIKRFGKDADRAKLEAYENRVNPPQVKMLKKSIKTLEKNAYALLSAKHSLDHLTKEGYADLCRLNFLILHSVRDEHGQRICIEDDAIISEKIFSALTKNHITTAIMRELSRTDPWRSIWNSCDINPFGVNPVDWTEDQKSLVLYSKMYDNCFEHPECPDDNIIEDDDLLDGWMIYQRKKAKEERKKNDKEMGEGEHFIIAKNEAHRRKIDEMNDATARNIRQQREAALTKHKGKMKEAYLPDVQMDLQMQANQMLRDKMKGK